VSYPTHCPTCRQPLTGLKRRYCGWGFATIDRCRSCGTWVLDDDGLDVVEHDAVPTRPEAAA
jgi:hypothetical protein